MAEIEIGEYKTEDRLSCIDLLKRTFPDSSNEKTFSWRFESRFMQSPLIVCAKDNGRVVSFNSWLRWEFQHNNGRYIGYQSGESATDERYRGRGIWSAVLKFADNLARARNVDFLFGFPSTMSYNAFFRAGYSPIGIFNFYVRIINPLRPFSSRLNLELADFPVRSLAEENKIIPIVDSKYFQWRYFENPKLYDILKYTEDGNHALFVIRNGRYYNKKYKLGWSEGFMLDCQFSSLNDVFIKNAFKYLDRNYARKVLNLRTFCNPGSARGKAIAKHFRIRLGASYETLCIKVINERINYNLFFDWNNWDIMPHVIDES